MTTLEQAQNADDERLRAVLEESADFFGEAQHMERVRPAVVAYLERREAKGEPRTAAELLEPMRMLLAANIDADEPAAVQETAVRLVEIVEANPELSIETAIPALAEVQDSYIRYGRLDVADDLHRRFAGILGRYDGKTAALGDLHDNMARMHLLGPAADPFKVERHWKDTLEVREAVFGPVSPAVAETLENLATIQGELGHVEDQRASLERVLAIRRGLGSPGSPDTTRALLALASHHRAAEDEDAARRYAEQARESCEAGGGDAGSLVESCVGDLLEGDGPR